jgi:hypothetical protein
MRAPLALVLAALVLAALVLAASPAAAGDRHAPAASDAAVARPLDAFALDAVSRAIPARGRFACPDVERVRYRGTALRLHKPVPIAAAFVPRVAAFEQLVIEVATRVYGRAPIRIRHLGGYVCRRMKTYPDYLSEHGVGDALDVEGFDFGPARSGERAAAPAGLRGGFRVRLARHWDATRGAGAVHARFLRELADAMIAREDLFRVILGPSYPGHRDHFHLDMSTFRMIEI